MTHRLRAGISYCEVAGQLIFLDLRRDRYFCLSTGGEAAFRRMAQGETPRASDQNALDRMAMAGLLVAGPRPLPCPHPPIPAASLIDDFPAPAGTILTVLALAQLARARMALRLLGLERTLGRLPSHRTEMRPHDSGTDVSTVAAAFRQAGLLITSLDRCLPRSIAVAHLCRRLGLAVDLVIGVRLQPFAAHCWVQQGNRLVSDRLDNVRNFTPILVR